MRAFIDHNLPAPLAHGLHRLSSHEFDVPVHALTDLFERTVPDHHWIGSLADQRGWIIITKDRMKKGRLEHQALARAGLPVFVLVAHWNRASFWEQSANIIRWWPKIIAQARGIEGGAMFEVPWQIRGGGKLRQLRL